MIINFSFFFSCRELRSCLDTIRSETEKQAGHHANLAGLVRTELENTAASLHARQLHHKKTFQAGIEKEFKTKQAQEAHVNKAREKYEADCVRINSYTAQSSLVQGKDLDKITLKLERAQQTVQTNERDFANFARVLQDTVARWEVNWKAFCDSCQDMEDQRIEFMRDNMWAYANAVSTVCVSDDEVRRHPYCPFLCSRLGQACEHIRVSLEQMETEKDMENFVREYGTGNQIPDPPAFVNYNTPDAIPSSSSRPTFRLAQHSRASQRETTTLMTQQLSEPPSEESEGPTVNTAGIGAGGSRRDSHVGVSRQPTQSRGRDISPNPAPKTNGTHSTSPTPARSPSSDPGLTRRPTNATHVSRQSYRVPPPPDPLSETIDPTAETYIKVGNNAYKADPNKDPQVHRVGSASPTKGVNGGIDPLAKQLEDLKNVVNSSGSVRRKSFLRQASPSDPKANQFPARQSTLDHIAGSSSLSIPANNSNMASGSGSQSSSSNANRDYRHSAENIVGTHPFASSSSIASRPASPNPPTAAFMIPKPPVTPSGSEIIEGVLSDYHQSLPGERKSISRSNSMRGSVSERRVSQSPPGHSQHLSLNQAQGQNIARPPSVGHAGIGAHGGSRSNSPVPGMIVQQSELAGPGPGTQPAALRRNSFISAPAAPVVRSASPNPVGIALDPTGRVSHDEMALAHQYHQHQQPQPQQLQQHQHQPQQPQQLQQHQRQPSHHLQQQQQQPVQQQPQQFNQMTNPQRRTSFIPPPVAAPPMAPPQGTYGVTPPPPPPPTLYQQPTGYMQPQIVPQQQPLYNQPPPPQQVQYQAPVQQPVYAGYQGANGPQRGSTLYYTNTGNPPPQQQALVPQQAQMQLTTPAYNPYGGYRGPSPTAGRTPSPQPPPAAPRQSQVAAPPTGQTTEEGYPILFYGSYLPFSALN